MRVYYHLFDRLSDQERFDLAYFFEFDYQERPGTGYTADLVQIVRQWVRVHDEASLFYWPVGTRSLLVDTRTEPRIWLLDETYTALLDSIDAIAVQSDLAGRLKIDSALLNIMLCTLDEHKWILQEGNKVLGLAIRLGRYQPSAHVQRILANLFNAQTGQATISGRISIPMAVAS